MSGDADAWIVEHIIVNMASNKKSQHISQQIPNMENTNSFVGVSREGGNENHHFVVVTLVEQKRPDLRVLQTLGPECGEVALVVSWGCTPLWEESRSAPW